MKGLVFKRPGVAEVMDVEVPTIGPGEVLLRMRTVGICHSDFGLLEGDYIIPFDYPVIPGHEWTGEVVEVGSGVSLFSPGDRVVGECAVTDDDHFGFTMNGALAELFKASASWLHKVPDELNDTMAALVEPFTIAYGAVSDIDGSDLVVILGAGPIGLCAVAAACAKGARVLVLEPDTKRQELAKTFGAERCLDPREKNVVARVNVWSGGSGATVVIECSGNPAAMALTFELAAFKGSIVYVGINPGASIQAPLGLIVAKALRIRGQVGSFGIWSAAMRFLAQTGLDLSPLISRRFPLSEAVAALDAAEQRDINIKIHVENVQK